MALKGSDNAEKIWNYLKDKGLNDCGTAGLMGNLYAESALRPTNLQQSYEKKLGYTDATYTAAVDSGAYSNFSRDSAGYGLAQWTYHTRKANMLAYAQAAKKSIGDLELQLDFLMKELTESYKTVFSLLKTTATVKAASDAVLTRFERPADQSEAAKTRRAGYGQKYYDKYAGGAASSNVGDQTEAKGMTEAALRQLVISTAEEWLGCKERDGSHRKIIDMYNTHKPYARGYKMTYTGAWCATFVSAVAIKLGLTDIIPTEVGCERQIELFKKLGSWMENDAYVPKPGDVIFYDWDDKTGSTGDNTGWSDHVAYVVGVTGSTINTIEGNVSDSVAYRKLAVNGKNIRGFGVPKYAQKAASGGVQQPVQPTQPTQPVQPDQPPKPAQNAGKFAVGDVVSFTGNTHYTSSNASVAKRCKPGRAKVTAKVAGAKHPYHLIRESGAGSTVYGWVDAADVQSEGGKIYMVKRGDSLWRIAASQLGDGKRYPEIKELNGLTTDTIRAGQALKLPDR